MRRALVLSIASVLVAVTVGCGGGGVSSGATVSAYVTAPLCAGAKRELAREGGRAGSIRVRVVCLPSARDGTRLSLATASADARRATEDSTTVGYIEPPDRTTARFTHPILESAGVAWISQSSGTTAMKRLLRAVEAADPGSLRESVRKALGEA